MDEAIGNWSDIVGPADDPTETIEGYFGESRSADSKATMTAHYIALINHAWKPWSVTVDAHGTLRGPVPSEADWQGMRHAVDGIALVDVDEILYP